MVRSHSQANTYTGDTTITAGEVILTGTLNSLTDLNIDNDAILDLRSAQTVATLVLDGTIENGDTDATNSSLTVSGASTLDGSITTDGNQTYAAITLAEDTTLTGGSQLTVGGTLDGTKTLQTNFTESELMGKLVAQLHSVQSISMVI